MIKGIALALAVSLCLWSTNAVSKGTAAEKLTAGEILKKVEATYAAMQTYKSEGTVLIDIQTNGMNVKMEKSFTLLLKKPNQYLISWKQKDFPMPGMSSSGAVWSDGSQPFLYMGTKGIANGYSKLNNDTIALGAATGISGGAAHTIPSRFFTEVSKNLAQPFSTLVNPEIEKSELLDEEDCFLIRGNSKVFKQESFWISKSRYIILKYSHSMEPPEGGREIPKMTDKQLEDAIRGLGQEVSAESIEKMRKMMKASAEIIKTVDIQGSSTEIHQKISSPELDASDFLFQLPEGAKLQKSMLDGLPNEIPEIQ